MLFHNADVLRLKLSLMPISVDLHVNASLTKGEIRINRPFFVKFSHGIWGVNSYISYQILSHRAV